MTPQPATDRTDAPNVPSPLADRLIRCRDVESATGLSKATIYRHMQAGNFPSTVVIGRAARWSQREVQQWVKDRLAERDCKAA